MTVDRTLAHYRIVARIGAGGMGEVYRATDTKLGRDVALKVLPADMASDPIRLERFRREAKALAALDHPGIVTVFSVEEADGVPFLTMQLVEGQPLDRLIPKGGLSVKRILKIAGALADALATAHDRGIIHRDLKPANIMVTDDGRVKVLDFGLAKVQDSGEAAQSASELPTEMNTRAGIVMGTVPYMSPEQLSGNTLDQRTDIYSLGVILYEMATGRQPFHGRSSAELASAILRDTPRPPGEMRNDLPSGLALVIGRCLQKDPEERFATARELRDVLAGAGISDSSAANANQVGVHSPSRDPVAATPADEGFWIAVLPFKWRGADANLEALAEGLSEDIVTGLSRFSYLRVISRSSTTRYAGDSGDVTSIARELRANYVMEGNLRQAGSMLRLNVQLVDSGTGAHLWAETYNRMFNPDAVFELQDDLVPRIVSTIADMNGVLPQSMSEAVRSRNPDELTPYEAVLRSFAYFQRIAPEELVAATSALESAVRKEPSCADAWALLALLCTQDYGQSFKVFADPLGKGAAAAQRAVEEGPSCHLAYFSLAQVLFFQKEFQRFHNAAERAAGLNAMDGNSIAFLGEMLIYTGDLERGLELAGRAKQLNPNHPGWYWYADYYHAYCERDYSGALGYVLKANLPRHWGYHLMLTAAYGQLGNLNAAAKAVQGLLSVKPDFASTVRRELEKWWSPEYVEHLIEGLRKAGVEVR